MIDLINLLDNNGKSAVYTGGYINDIYRYIEMLGSPKTLITSGQRYHNLRPSSYSKNDAATNQPVIAALRTR